MFIASQNKLKAKLHLQMFLANANRLEDLFLIDCED